MHIHFTLYDLLQERGMTVYNIYKNATLLGKKVNQVSLSNIRDNTIKRLPYETIEAICYTLQVTPDDWIHIEGCPHPLVKPARSVFPRSDQLNVLLKYYMTQKGFKTVIQLTEWLDAHDIPYRLATLRKIHNKIPVQIPLELLAGISAALERSPGAWLRVLNMKFQLHKILADKGFALEYLYQLLVMRYKEHAPSVTDLEFIYTNRGYQANEELIHQLMEVLDVTRDELIHIEPF